MSQSVSAPAPAPVPAPVSASAAADKPSPSGACVSCEPYLRGAVDIIRCEDGLIQPCRFFPKQMEILRAAGRGHRAVATSGISLDFVTTGDEVSLECRITRALNPDNPMYGDTMRHVGAIGRAEDGVIDGIDLVVGGSSVLTAAVCDGMVSFHFNNPGHERREVRICLPNIMSVTVGGLRSNGVIEPAPERGYLLALGDSITQGCVVGCPSLSYPSILAYSLDLDLVNQAVAGYWFDKATLRGLAPLRDNPPVAIVVAYGTNDWHKRSTQREIRDGARGYFEKLHWRFPNVPVYALTPLWRDDALVPAACGKTLPWMASVIAEACREYPNVRVVDGWDVLPHNGSLLADGRVHPDSVGAGVVAEAILAAMEERVALTSPSLAAEMETTAEESVAAQASAEKPVAPQPADERPVATAPQLAPGPVALADASSLGRAGAPGTHPEFDALVRTIWRLRQPDGCPWDKEQTHASISKNMVEEAYEAVDAIAQGEPVHLEEELGDVLMQVLLHAQIDADDGGFDIDGICHELNEKLVRRHPHVFGEGVSAANSEEVLDIWDSVKLEENAKRASGLLDAVPTGMPALMQSQKISKKAAAAGFEWETTDDVWRKVEEERAEFAAEKPGTPEAELEFGDILFALVNVARREHVDAEAALRASCDKFRRRWASMEAAADGRGVRLDSLDQPELECLWQAAKAEEQPEGEQPEDQQPEDPQDQ